MKLRRCSSEDEESLVALWRACGLTRPWNDPHADLTKALETPNATVIVGLEDEALIASVMVGFDGHRGWIYYLAVDPARRHRGHGRAMMTAAEQWLAEHGAPKLQLMVRHDNPAATGFYEHLGLERQPAVLLGKRLDRTSGNS